MIEIKNYALLFLQTLWSLSLDIAPWLVLGLFIGGVFKGMLPENLLNKHLKGNGLAPVIKAALLGIPLPLCSCGVIPAALGLRQAGASKAATASFLVSTPETGVDSISITYAMMGGFMTIARPLAAFFSAILTGCLLLFFGDKENNIDNNVTKSCCASKKTANAGGKWQAIIAGLRYSFVKLFNDSAKWLLIGIIFATFAKAFIPEQWLNSWGDSWITMLIMLVVGVPMYVCASASTPIASGFLLAGISPGAVLVYLLAGPATNVATLGIVYEQLGKRAMLLYLTGIIGGALLSGFIVNIFFAKSQFDIAVMHHEHALFPSFISICCLVFLLGLALVPRINKS